MKIFNENFNTRKKFDEKPLSSSSNNTSTFYIGKNGFNY
jgi:hypothetical protein